MEVTIVNVTHKNNIDYFEQLLKNYFDEFCFEFDDTENPTILKFYKNYFREFGNLFATDKKKCEYT